MREFLKALIVGSEDHDEVGARLERHPARTCDNAIHRRMLFLIADANKAGQIFAKYQAAKVLFRRKLARGQSVPFSSLLRGRPVIIIASQENGSHLYIDIFDTFDMEF